MFPEPGDRLFRDNADHALDKAFINYFSNAIDQYILGYQQAAEALINLSLEDRTKKDVLIYPIIFIYRQYVELRLKECIGTLNFCIHGKREFPNHHYLDKLWEAFKDLYKEAGESITDNDFKNMDRLILEFYSKDPTSMVFRYPSDKKGKTFLAKTEIDIRNFSEVMVKVSAFLDACSDFIANLKDNLP